ncbi:DUF6382 domain-containing protein [Paenibacillus sp. Marseille-Q4541]|uniref:DUF6382 domain-containing protein n=1 Tax=Paenibacillus sp. Marseille-Q4541 TaxID=2831522 RepID=UPI001BA87319|nr:DUF6382 domain-containing protein [Paenibacillus sp. Marseille-Q4541]
MIGLKRDFIHNGKAMMTIDKTGGFIRNDLSEVQLQMLISNAVPGHLGMSIKEINQEVTFIYDITGKKMLSQTARYEKLTLKGLFQLLLQVTQTLLSCPQYMLDEQRYVLHEDYIFTTDTLEEAKVYLCYIPAPFEKEVESVPLQLNQMVIRLMLYVKALEGSGIQRIIQLCNDSNFQLVNLQELLTELLLSESEVEGKSSVKTDISQDMLNPHASFDNRDQTKTQNPLNGPGNVIAGLQRSTSIPRTKISELPNRSSQVSHSSVPFKNAPFEQIGSLRPDSAADSMRGTILSKEDEEVDTKPSKPIYYWLGGLLVASIVWRFIYMDEPTTVRLAICVVLTVVLAVAAYMLSVGKLVLGKKTKKDVYSTSSDFPDVESSSSFPLFQGQREETSTPVLGKRGIFGGKDKNKENTEPWRWNTETQHGDESYREMNIQSSNTSYKLEALGSNLSFSASEALENGSSETAASYYDSLRHNTQLLNSSHAQATVLLTDSVQSADNPAQSAILTSKKGILERQSPLGSVERIELGTGSFIIGRSEEVSQFVENGKGTSRAHIEISASKDQYCIKDLNSMNGTLLLDKPMVPYKEYPLEEGDFFIIAETKYTFHYV